MSEYIVDTFGIVQDFADLHGDMNMPLYQAIMDVMVSRQREEIVRCRDCKYLDDSEYSRWDSSLAECYGEPPLFCDLLSFNEWRMDGDRRVAETTFAEVEPDGFCKWGERRDA